MGAGGGVVSAALEYVFQRGEYCRQKESTVAVTAYAAEVLEVSDRDAVRLIGLRQLLELEKI